LPEVETNGSEVPAVDAWDAWRPEEVAERLAAVDVQWAVAAGWAIELFVGSEPRSHEDIEIVVPRDSFPAIAAALPELDWYGAGDGRLCVWDEMPEQFHQTWGWDRSHACWRVDVFREPWQGDTWICRRDASIRRPWPSAVEWTSEGVPYLAPEIVLLFKARHSHLEKNKVDLARTLPLLDPERRRWLVHALHTVHPDHEWIARVAD
jgi:hypothetical protein